MLQLELVVLRCADVNRSRLFYEALGIDLAPTETDGFQGKAGDTQIELCPSRGKEGLLRIGLRCSQIAQIVEGLKMAGGSIVRTLGAPKLLYAVVKDPDGHTVELRSAD